VAQPNEQDGEDLRARVRVLAHFYGSAMGAGGGGPHEQYPDSGGRTG
jgi:hypothetical protein